MKFLVFMCGEGLGHTGRCIAIGKELLAAGYEVCFGAYGYSKELVEKERYEVYRIPQELRLAGKEGTFDLKESIKSTLSAMDIAGIHNIFKLIKSSRPDAVISDGYYLGIVAAYVKKVPIYIIVNQSNMVEFFQEKGFFMGLLGTITKRFYDQVYTIAHTIIVPDFPAPHTVCRNNLSFSEKVQHKIRYTGPIIRKRPEKATEKNLVHPHVLCTIGGFGYRLPILQKVISAAKLDKNIHYTIVTGPNVNPAQLAEVPENVEVQDFIADPFSYYKSTDVVISACGHGTTMETLSYGVPILAFPDRGQKEQENNAQLIDEMGYGKRMYYEVSADLLLMSIREVLESSAIKENTKMLKKLASEMEGAVFMRKLLEKDLRSHAVPNNEDMSVS
ncbi:MAG TPA: glycosyltransferase [Methanomethylovorans sp.]|nr:glycosyltransferase [Methanomethylovorans sp.]